MSQDSTSTSKATAAKAKASAESPKGPAAVIVTQGQQFLVSVGDTLTVSRVATDAGSSFKINNVLAMLNAGGSPTVGTPGISGASVEMKVLKHFRGEKIEVFKKRRRKGYTKTQGHRQELSTIRVLAING